METIVNNVVKSQTFNNYVDHPLPKFPMELDEKIHDKVAVPIFEESGSIKEKSDSISLDNRIETDICPPKPLLERINDELELFDKMLNDPSVDPALILQQAFRIIELLQKRLAHAEKSQVLNKDSELWEDVQKLKGTYNAWDVLATALISGLLTTAGGFTTIASVLPGTTAGQSLAAAFPDVLQFFADANNAKTLTNVGDGMKGVGQGSDIFQRIFSNGDEAKRVVLNYLIENGKRKQSDSQDAYRGAREQVHGANNQSRSVAQTFHDTILALLKERG